MPNLIKGAIFSAMLLCGSSAMATPVTLTFEGIPSVTQIGSYYDGGAGGNYGIDFGPDALAGVSVEGGGTGLFSNNPSGHTIALFLSGPGDVMNVAAGFDTGFSFFYSASQEGSVSVYSGLNGTGSLLSTLELPFNLSETSTTYDVWSPVGVSFAGTAQSVIFSGAANNIGFDNITLGSASPAAVPELTTWAMLALGLGFIGGGLRHAQRSKQVFAFRHS